MLTVTDYAPACTESIRTDVVQDHSVSPVLTLVAEKLGEKRFDLWFGQDTQCDSNTERITFYTSKDFRTALIRRHCKKEIDQAVLEIFGKNLPIDFVVKPPQKIVPKKPTVPSIPVPIQATNTSPLATLFKKPEQDKDKFGRRFASLSTFLEGLSNREACRAADWAINHPGKISPIYIFGPTSVGKTHLLEGIWSEIKKTASRRLPMYMTAEQFLSAFTETIRYSRSGSVQDRNQTFRSRFKNVSHLLIDDIQFLSRGDATQTEFLQVFDMLRNQGVQLVFTGNRPLKDLPLRNELLCRLESGLICGIELPERELSLRICENMVRQLELPMDTEVCRLIASRFGVHARQISGALNRLYAAHLTTGESITVAGAEETLSDLLRLNRRDVRLEDISKIVCETFSISEETLRSKSRVKQIAAPRMLAMWLARKYTRSALSEIGLYFGNHSHSSVISAQKKIDKQICNDKSIAETVQRIEQALG
jgi:chromosomal replication initiator protein